MLRSTPVLQSTPHRPSGSKHTSSNHFKDTPAPKQDILKQTIAGSLDAAVQALKHACVQLPVDGVESEHYQPLMTFLNACVDACCIYDKSLFYDKLKFIVFNTPTQDGVQGASPLKPDGTGSNGLSEGNKRLWWRPESGNHSSTLEIPI
jgi:hypothetical protein